jgi:serine/threonine-protein kinase
VPSDGDPDDMITGSREMIGDSSSMQTFAGVSGPGGRPTIVLLAGVDAGSRAIARVALGHAGEILEATDAETVAKLARERRPDVVLVEGSLPDADAICKGLRADAVTRDAKILVLAGRQGARRQVASLGADDSLPTPFSPLQLQVKLRRMLGKGTVGT